MCALERESMRGKHLQHLETGWGEWVTVPVWEGKAWIPCRDMVLMNCVIKGASVTQPSPSNSLPVWAERVGRAAVIRSQPETRCIQPFKTFGGMRNYLAAVMPATQWVNVPEKSSINRLTFMEMMGNSFIRTISWHKEEGENARSLWLVLRFSSGKDTLSISLSL